jgi:hypothetical protein
MTILEDTPNQSATHCQPQRRKGTNTTSATPVDRRMQNLYYQSDIGISDIYNLQPSLAEA